MAKRHPDPAERTDETGGAPARRGTPRNAPARTVPTGSAPPGSTAVGSAPAGVVPAGTVLAEDAAPYGGHRPPGLTGPDTASPDTVPPAAHGSGGAAPAGDALARYLRGQATEFLRALRLHREAGGPEGPAEAARALRRSARRISGTLHTFQAHLDADWAEAMRPELAWVSGTLALEYTYASRLERLLGALHRLSGVAALPAQATGGHATTADTPGTGTGTGTATVERGTLTVGAVKAGALLERRMTLARTRAHSTTLQALGSSRFHAVADKVAVLASEVPLARPDARPELRTAARAAEERLVSAVAALPLVTAGSPYNSQALLHGLSPDPAPHPQDAPWHQVRLLLRLHRYARELLHGPHPGEGADARLLGAGQALDRHRDASEAAAAAAHAARTPRIAPATAYALGVLHADQRHEVEAARYAFQRCWSRERSVSTT